MSKTQESPKDSKDPKGGGKIRVFALAAELNVDTKAVLEFCKELGYGTIKNQLSGLEHEQVDAIRDRVKKGARPSHAGPAHAPTPPKPVAPPKLDSKIPTLSKPKTLPSKPTAPPVAEAPVAPPAIPAAVPAAAAPEKAPPKPVTAPVAESTPVVPPAVKPADIEVAKPEVPTHAPIAPPEPAHVAHAAAPAAAKPTEPVTPPAVTVTHHEVAALAAVTHEPAAAVEPKTVAPTAPREPVHEPAAVVAEAAAPTTQPASARPNPQMPPPLAPRGVPNLNARGPVPGNKPPVLGGNRPPVVLPPKPPGAPQTSGGPPKPPVQAGPPAGHTPPVRPQPAFGPAGAIPPRSGPSAPPPFGGARPGAPGQGQGHAGSGGARPPFGPGGPPRQGGPGMGGGGGSTRAGGLPHRTGGPGGPRGGPGPAASGPRPAAGAGGPPGAAKTVKLSPEQIERLRLLERKRGEKISIQDIPKATAAPAAPAGEGAKPGGLAPGGPARPGRPMGEGGEADDGKGGKRPGEVAGRDQRHKTRQDKGRQHRPLTDRSAIIIGTGGRVDMIETQHGSRIKKHRGKQHVKPPKVVTGGRIEIALPITVRTLSETIGMKVGELILKLKNLTNSLFTINSGVEFEVAEMIAIEKKIELVAKKQVTAESSLEATITERKASANQLPRPPIVTIMGHVDHGKTSLLDRIRQQYGLSSDVVSTEAGGITQVLRAWRVEKGGKSTTFLDTPGHEAFTKMRARGANVTDIAVIVVSASDGVMPQTEEAIAHARAADVDIIVAINKVDLPDANIDKTRRQLYQLNLLPDTMGGDVPFVECSAKTGKGIDELLDSVAVLAELAELTADPTQAGSGTCLEAYLEGDRGVIATLLVQNGTLSKGDVVLCGATFGRVRAMYDDLGRPIEEAGPSTPVKFIGLDEVPDADDPFYVVDNIATAREIAGKRRERRSETDRFKFQAVNLDKLKEQNAKIKITELKVILKAEARGSVEAIKKELEKLVHEEVRVRVLHAAIGAISESDITLALTSPENTMIVGFNVTADDAALKLAEQRGISLREYQIIYNLVDDVKAALEGRLKPVEEVVHLGRAIVRETFKISKTGTIAGCYVTSGTIERNAKVRVIRDGTVLYPPAEKTASLDSLKRFKDDAKEVREGFECGMKIAGFDDIKVGDVIEAYRIEIRQRTL
ncbi:translation initiation factor IF-2 [Fimbriiglobus ruber]|uniref:Translation initiation factor IF-2 n=1 Tax=Fimbriiglobus ruber TaxID=1908690 RepID=A0A225D8D0_9BACT|nr:translation initiation factor IF-2 [Fimbriiglobus ruber]OWK35884.1 Translation initiation factor 2 [Fimbriiglobus ruber]